MKLAEVEERAMALPEGERASLIARLLQSLPATDLIISDDEVTRRDEQLSSGEVSPITHAEFVERVERERR
jgi:hypothetical protein